MDKDQVKEILEGIKTSADEKFEAKADKSEIETKADKAEVKAIKEELESVVAKFDSIPAINKNEEKMESITDIFNKSFEEKGVYSAEIETKALNQARNVTGAPTATFGITASLIDQNPVRGLAAIFNTTATAVQLPVLTGSSDFTKVGATRAGAASADNTSTAGVVNVQVDTFEKREDVAVETADDIPNFDLVYSNRLLNLFGRTEAKEHVAKIEAATAVTTDAVGVVSLDDLGDLYSQLSVGYRANAVLMVSSGMMSNLRTMSQSGSGSDLMFDPQSGTFKLWGKAVVENPYMASVATGNVVAALADWQEAFAIVDRSTFEIGRYTQTAPGNYTYYAKPRVGSAIWHEDAIRVLTVA